MSIATVADASLDTPLLGVSGHLADEELRLARAFTELHNLIYDVGGIKPTNAAIEEVAKLIALRLWAERAGTPAAAETVRAFAGHNGDPTTIVRTVKSAFVEMLTSESLTTVDTEGNLRPLWPTDEPLRLEQPRVLGQAMKIVEGMLEGPVRVSDPLGTAFDAFLSGRYDHAGGLGTYLTPSAVARMMATVGLSLVEDSVDSRTPTVIDPFCGTGRFLVAAYEVLVDRGVDPERLSVALNTALIGADQSTSAVAKSGLNLLLLGATRPTVFTVSDSISAHQLVEIEGSVDLVLTNPPFGGGKYSDKRGIDRTRNWFPSVRGVSIDPALGGLALSLDLIRPGGVVAIVLPDGIVNGREFSTLLDRSDLYVAASVSLPTATFALSGTVAKTSAVFIRKSSKIGQRTVLARVNHVGFIRQAGKATRDPEGNELPLIAPLLAQGFQVPRHSDEVVSVSSEPLAASLPAVGVDNVDPARLDPDATQSRASLLRDGGIHLREVLRAQKTRRAPRRAEPFVSVLHVDAFGATDWTQAETYDPTTPGQIAEAGDILVSLLNPSKLRATVIPPNYPQVQCSLEFGVFRTAVDPYAVLALLYDSRVHVQLRPLGSGTSSSRRRISAEDVLDLVVPSLSSDEMAALGRSAKRAIDAIAEGRRTLHALYSA